MYHSTLVGRCLTAIKELSTRLNADATGDVIDAAIIFYHLRFAVVVVDVASVTKKSIQFSSSMSPFTSRGDRNETIAAREAEEIYNSDSRRIVTIIRHYYCLDLICSAVGTIAFVR